MKLRLPDIGDRQMALLLALFFLVMGSLFATCQKTKLEFNQNRYEAVVIRACTGVFGEIDPVQKPNPALDIFRNDLRKFLNREIDALSCSDIPDGTLLTLLGEREKGGASGDSELYARAHYYTSITVATLWSLLGVKWKVVKIAYILLYGLSLASACFFFRNFVPPAMALLLTMALHLSPGFFDTLFRLRDFSKTPFIFTVLACTAALLVKSRRFRQNLPYVALAGIAAGIGLGFRVDLLVVPPLFLAAWFMLCPPSLDKKWWQKPVGAGIFITLFMGCGSPAIIGWFSGNTDGQMHHVLTLGQMDTFDAPLAVNPAPYSLGYHYHDAYVCLVTNAQEQQSGLRVKGCIGENYAKASADLYFRYLSLTPGDQILRSISALFQVMQRHYGLGDDKAQLSGFLSLLAVIAGLAVMGAQAPRAAIFIFASLTYLGGITALQFSLRHSVYLDIYFWLLAGYLFTQARASWPPRRANLLMPAVMLAGFVLMAAGLWIGRDIQKENMAQLISRLKEARMKNLDWELRDGDIKPFFNDTRYTPFHARYLALDINPARCGKDPIQLDIKYTGTKNFSERQTLSSEKNAPFTFFVPVFFRRGTSEFDGFSLPAEQITCLTGLRSAENFDAAGFPLQFMLSQADVATYRQTSSVFSDHAPRVSGTLK